VLKVFLEYSEWQRLEVGKTMKPLCRKVCIGLRLALFALTVPLALAAVMLIWQDHNSRRDAIITQVELKSAQVNAQLEDFLHRIDSSTAVFASNWTTYYGPDKLYPTELAAMNSSLLRLANAMPEFSAASITDSRGTVIAASDASIYRHTHRRHPSVRASQRDR